MSSMCIYYDILCHSIFENTRHLRQVGVLEDNNYCGALVFIIITCLNLNVIVSTLKNPAFLVNAKYVLESTH